MCRNCGALVGAGEQNCSLCGAPKDAVPAAAPQVLPEGHDHETMRFARAILTRPYIFTIIFIVANIFVFFLTMQAGAEQNPAVLVRYGAKLNSLIDGQNEWWRFVTPIFLHGNVAHLLMNMYGLWIIGPYVERLYGSAKFVFFWVVTGIAGVAASYLSVQPQLHSRGALGRFLFKADDAISVGASGALFGLIGVLFVFGIKFRHELPEGFKRAFGVGMLPTILLNIFIGYMIPVIDNAAHMGGLVMGALLALVVGYKRPGESAGVAVFWHVLQVLALATVVVGFVMVARHFNQNYTRVANVPQHSQNEGDYVKAFNDGIKALATAATKGEAGGLEEAIKELEAATFPDQRSGELRDELKTLLTRARDYTQMPSTGRKQQQARMREQQKLLADFEEWDKKFNEWVKNEGGKYGIYLSEPPPQETQEK